MVALVVFWGVEGGRGPHLVQQSSSLCWATVSSGQRAVSCLQLRPLLPGCQLVGAAQLTIRRCAACLPVSCRLSCSTTLASSSWQTRQSSRHGMLRRSSTASSTPSTGTCVWGERGRHSVACFGRRNTVSSSERGVAALHTCISTDSPGSHAYWLMLVPAAGLARGA